MGSDKIVGIYSDWGFKFEALGFTLHGVTKFSATHGKYITAFLLKSKDAPTITADLIYHEELAPEEYDALEAMKFLYLRALAKPG